MRLSTRWVVAASLGAAVSLAGLSATTTARAGTYNWTIATSPNPGTSQNQLNADTCVDDTHCWAVGSQGNTGSRYQTLIEQWNGTSWSVDSSGNENNGTNLYTNFLQGVSCVSSTDCWAVGTFVNASTGFEEPLWEQWNGATWTASTFLVGVATNYWLDGVSCVDAHDCWAVGYKQSGTGPDTTWVEQWNGSAWNNDPDTQSGALYGVSCVDVSHCWAVGDLIGSPTTNVIQFWNGTAWTTETAPDQGSHFNELVNVTCVNTSWCWAVGFYNDGTQDQALLAHWDGTSWTIPADLAGASNDSPSETFNSLSGVTCVSTSLCWAVGDYH
ncbi:MAG: hypothetical protein JO287_03545, partial [Pseudonocardiales bacterium]|nr:hypothetical protein [Pseudonocardiales bacterium]